MPSISVISAVYNKRQYLEECFLSIRNQTFTDFELILIDDGSTDGSGEICDAYAEKDPRIKVFHQKNQGPATARNVAVKLSSTDWITFIDCDDVVHSRYLEVLYDGATKHNVLISGVNVYESDVIPPARNGTVDVKWKRYDSDEAFLMGDLCSSYFGQINCAKLVNKQLLVNIPFTDGRVFEDNAVVKKWIYYAGTVVYTDSCLYYYRINNAGVSKDLINAKKVEDVLWSRDEIIDFYKQKGFTKAYINAERNYILFAIGLYFRLNRIDERNSKKLKKQILARYKKDKEFIDFSKENKMFVFELKHPKLMWLYWKIKSIM